MDVDFRREPPEPPGLQHVRVLGAWPLLLNLELACAYLGVSPVTFRKICPVPAVALSAAVTRWNRHQIDEWANSLPPKTGSQLEAASLAPPPYEAAKEASEARRQASIQKIRERSRDRFNR